MMFTQSILGTKRTFCLLPVFLLVLAVEGVVNKLWEEYELTPNNVENYKKPENVQETTKRVNSLRNKIKDLGSINIDSIEEYNQTKQRYDFMCEQRLDLEDGISKLKKVIQDMTNIPHTAGAIRIPTQ